MEKSRNPDKIIELIQYSKLDEALNILLNKIANDSNYIKNYNSLSLIKARFEQLKKDEKDGIIEISYRRIELNRITKAIQEEYLGNLQILFQQEDTENINVIEYVPFDKNDRPEKISNIFFILLWIKTYKITTFVILILSICIFLIAFYFS